jgi:tRNA threonylcarbamoyladenosine biosynthesis protein TsaE
LLEPYYLPQHNFYHLDLYRLADPAELEYLGLRDLVEDNTIWLIEWPEQGIGVLPAPDVRVIICHADNARETEIVVCSPLGGQLFPLFHVFSTSNAVR